MNATQIFIYEQNQIRTVLKDGEPWFVLKDVCEALGLTNPSIVADRLDDDERAKFDLGRQGETNIVNEPGLYSVILRSDKPEAKAFKRWVTHEVLPSIHKHGAYMTPPTIEALVANPDMIIELATQLKKEQQAHKNTTLLLDAKTTQLDESLKWFSIKRVGKINGVHWKSFDWRKLKNTSDYLGYEVMKIFDANYGHVNAYHIDIWKQEYPECMFS